MNPPQSMALEGTESLVVQAGAGAVAPDLQVVGRSAPRKDARDKVTGRAQYTTDIVLPGMLHAKVLRSARAHARIVAIDAGAARQAPGVHRVVTGADIPSHMVPYYGYFIKDQPIVALDKVRYVGDIVCAVAAETEAAAIAALRLVRVTYEDLPVAAGIEQALADDACALFDEAPMGVVPAYGDGASAQLRPRKNVCYQFDYRTGDATAFARCDHVFEDEFRFSRMTHYHLEPFVSVADVRGDAVQLWTSCQNPFPLRKELARMFKLPENRITVNVPFVGGGFGAKNNVKTEAVSVLLSLLTGRPVRFCLTMEEGFLTNTQHAAILRLKTGVMADGRLVARQSEILLDAGAYSDGSPLVAEKAGYRIPGPYRWEHIDTACLCVMTNTAPAGPFRGFGGTQTSWASESQIDMIARRLGIDPYDLRMRNLLRLGDPFVPGESGIDSDLREGLDLVCKEIGYHERSHDSTGTVRRGMGISIGFKDGGGVNKPAQARVKVSTSGDVFLQCGTVEIGQGARTALSQITAEILGVPLDKVSYAPINTDYLPFDQGTNASSGIAVMGQAIARAAHGVRDQILAFAAAQLGVEAGALQLGNGVVLHAGKAHPLAPMVMRHYGGTGFEFSSDGFFKAPGDHHAPLEAPCVFWEIGWGAAEVAVDTATGQVKVLKLVASGDAGRAINPLMIKGQEDGAAVMGLGQTLFEQMIYDDQGRLRNADPLTYRVPLAEDLPHDFVTITQEQGHGPGPFGAKGAGEGTILPIASAVANAIHDAIGVRITTLPITPVRVLEALTSSATNLESVP
ncbi:xanthine dehydrogenase family protein molybdopterin-binding subunit [Comamonadaceae bacterium G21597-S1]|nr:xanthine dehydrogenase family protein molybdopterin-binding subunit [Comamonadaceae bacterium G21597-S1]